jgi:hypothetical protein
MRTFLIASMLLLTGITANAQLVAEATPPGTSCKAAPTYDQGLNITISVITMDKYSDADLERTLARDIARFKDTNVVTAGSDSSLPIGKRRVTFEVSLFWAELKSANGAVVDYVGSYFIEETCAVFNHRNSPVPGFATHELIMQSPLSGPRKTN